jgi:glycogen synthase
LMKKENDRFEHVFRLRLESWVPLRSSLYDYFSQNEIDCLERSARTFNISRRRIIYLSFENRLVQFGGLTAVNRFLPDALVSAGEQVIVLSPFHASVAAKRALEENELEECFPFTVFHLCAYTGKIRCLRDRRQNIPTYYLDVEKQFTAGENPYSYPEPEFLLLDSLVFAAAVPFVLNKLGIKENLIIHCHDWETAPVAVTSRFAVISGLLEHARTVLTLHNSYDAAIGKRHKLMFFGKQIPGDTVLQCSLPMLSGPLTTVSTVFAHELCHDPLQRGVFVNHLQSLFSKNPPIGIENGVFGSGRGPFEQSLLKKDKKQIFADLASKKEMYRGLLREELSRMMACPGSIGKLELSENDRRTPVFVMLGRLDLMQKGFDVVFHAFKRLPEGKARLIFCPSSGSNPENLSFFKETAEERKGEIVLFPFRITNEQYALFLRGASFFIMPSFYEPFGSVTEAFLNGTPVLARATGGLWAQVNSLNDIEIPQEYSSFLHFDNSSHPPAGILFREKNVGEDAERHWWDLVGLPPEERISNPVFSSMVDSFYSALGMAIDAFSRTQQYISLIYNGLREVEMFSWADTAEKYRKVYDTVSYRGM